MKQKLLLTKQEVYRLVHFLLHKKQSFNPIKSTIEEVVLVEFLQGFIPIAQRIMIRNEPKKGFTVNLPLSVVRVLHLQLRNEKFDSRISSLLSKMDAALVNYKNGWDFY